MGAPKNYAIIQDRGDVCLGTAQAMSRSAPGMTMGRGHGNASGNGGNVRRHSLRVCWTKTPHL